MNVFQSACRVASSLSSRLDFTTVSGAPVNLSLTIFLIKAASFDIISATYPSWQRSCRNCRMSKLSKLSNDVDVDSSVCRVNVLRLTRFASCCCLLPRYSALLPSRCWEPVMQILLCYVRVFRSLFHGSKTTGTDDGTRSPSQRT